MQKPKRRHLLDERSSITHKFVIHSTNRRDEAKLYKGYITVGVYEDGSLGELFVRIDKIGSLINGLLDSLAIAVSIGLQYGIPLGVFVKKFTHMRFHPEGFTNNAHIPIAKSPVDYIFRWLGMKFLSKEEKEDTGL